MKDIRLAELINADILQRVLDGFGELTGMSAAAVDEKGVLLTKDSGFFRHDGLTDYAAPIWVNERFAGEIICIQKSGQCDDKQAKDSVKFLTQLAALISDMACRNYKILKENCGNEKTASETSDTDLTETMYNFEELIKSAVKECSGILEDKSNKIAINILSGSLSLFGDTEKLSRLVTAMIVYSNNQTRNDLINISAYTKKVDYADMLIMEIRGKCRKMPAERELLGLRMLAEQLAGSLDLETEAKCRSLVRVTIPQLEMKQMRCCG